MFGFLKRKRNDVVDALVKQTLGGQAVLYDLFQKAFECNEDAVRRLELTYFSATVMTFVYLRHGKEADKEKLLNDFNRQILKKCIPVSREEISFEEARLQYQQRYSEYDTLLSLFFNPKDSDTGKPVVTLMLHVFECVSQTSAAGERMLDVVSASEIMGQFVLDYVNFVQSEI